MNLDKLAFELEETDGVERCHVWAKQGKGRGRIYIDLPRLNGGKNWNGDSAGTVFFDEYSKTIVVEGIWAGAATRDNAKPILERLSTKFNFKQISRKDLRRYQRKATYQSKEAR